MAWIDNRAWAHPKVANLSDPAFRVWVSGLCYACGFVTEGRLTKQQQKIVGSTPRLRRELEDAGLWLDEGPDVLIHDWDEHNGKRDEKERARKLRDRVRKAEERAKQKERPPDSPADSPPDVPGDGREEIHTLTGDRVTGDCKDQNLLQRPRTIHDLTSSVETHLGRSV